MTREEQLEFLEAMVTEMLNFRSLVYLLSMTKVAAAEARRNKPA